VPEAEAEQLVKDPSAPPAGTASAKETLDPDSVPDTVPDAFVPVPLSVRLSVPEKALPDCVMDHDISPDPDESVAVPDHDPLTVAGVLVDGVVLGVVGALLAPPLHAAAATADHSARPARTPESRESIIVETSRILACPRSIDLQRETS